eukprot:s3145_g9.t1
MVDEIHRTPEQCNHVAAAVHCSNATSVTASNTYSVWPQSSQNLWRARTSLRSDPSINSVFWRVSELSFRQTRPQTCLRWRWRTVSLLTRCHAAKVANSDAAAESR